MLRENADFSQGSLLLKLSRVVPFTNDNSDAFLGSRGESGTCHYTSSLGPFCKMVLKGGRNS